MEKNSTEWTLLYLLKCALHDTVPELDRDTDFGRLYRLSRFHSVAAMVSAALERGGYLAAEYMDEALIRDWRDVRSNTLRKNILFDAEREEILRFFEEKEIWYMPLKGCVLKNMYPEYGIRQMADNDILFDPAGRRMLRDYMEARGYKTEQYMKNIHDVYTKPPVFNFEFHVQLFGPAGGPEWIRYYETVKDRLVKDTDNRFGYQFRDEDFYIYFVLHMFKHYRAGGTGIRSLVDLFVYLNQKAEYLDWNYIRGELILLEAGEFEENVRTLAMQLFWTGEVEIFTREQQEMLKYLLGSGTYGTTENRIRKKLSALQENERSIAVVTKLKFCLRRLFPGLEYMKMYAPFCYRHKWLIPFFWVYRLVRGLRKNHRFIRAEIRALRKIK